MNRKIGQEDTDTEGHRHMDGLRDAGLDNQLGEDGRVIARGPKGRPLLDEADTEGHRMLNVVEEADEA